MSVEVRLTAPSSTGAELTIGSSVYDEYYGVGILLHVHQGPVVGEGYVPVKIAWDSDEEDGWVYSVSLYPVDLRGVR